MNRNLRKALGCLVLAESLFSAHAQMMYDEIREGAFVGVNGGGAIMPDFNLSASSGFFFPINHQKAKADAGGAFDFYGGYQFNEYFALAANTGFIYNRVNEIGDAPVSPDRLELWQNPLMADAIFSFPLGGPVSAYVGGGAGVVFTTVNLELQDFGTVNDTDATFGYQAFVGVKYAMTEVTEIGVGYKFMAAGNHDWSDSGVDLSTDHLYTHSILATFTFRF